MGGVGNGKQGFASMDRDKQRAIASKGGKAGHAKGRSHEWTSEEARIAGRKGGTTSALKRRNRLNQSAEPLDRSTPAGKDAAPAAGGDTNVGTGGAPSTRRTWPDSY